MGVGWGVVVQLYDTVPLFVMLHAHLQGVLSESVQWPVLHEQLMNSRQSHGKLRQYVVHTCESRHGCVHVPCVCLFAHVLELFFPSEQVPPLHVRDRCSSAEEEGE